MSRRLDLRRHLQQLEAVKDIMNVMKDLAFMETAKLTRRMSHARDQVAALEQAAADFLAAWPGYRPEPEQAVELLVVFGSERGFCGDFNERLVAALERRAREQAGSRTAVLAVGYKLGLRLRQHPGLAATVPGAGVTEEVYQVLTQLTVAIRSARADLGGGRVLAICHDGGPDGIGVSPLLPPFRRDNTGRAGAGSPPLLNLAPEEFYSRLVDAYLFTSLHTLAYQSLLAENQQRIQHMSAAVRRLDRTSAEQTRKYHQFYQEEITEEIEIILLNAGSAYLDTAG